MLHEMYMYNYVYTCMSLYNIYIYIYIYKYISICMWAYYIIIRGDHLLCLRAETICIYKLVFFVIELNTKWTYVLTSLEVFGTCTV